MSDVCLPRRYGVSTFSDIYGLRQIVGVTYQETSGTSVRVHLHSKQSGRLVKRTISDADGEYRFQYLSGTVGDYYAVGLDFRSAPATPGVSDSLTVEDMVIADF